MNAPTVTEQLRGWIIALDIGTTPRLPDSAPEETPTPVYAEVCADVYGPVRERVSS